MWIVFGDVYYRDVTHIVSRRFLSFSFLAFRQKQFQFSKTILLHIFKVMWEDFQGLCQTVKYISLSFCHVKEAIC